MDLAKNVVGRSFLGLQLMGGKISEVPIDSSSFYPRQSKFFIDIFSFWDSAVYQQENTLWNELVYEKIRKKYEMVCYVGFPKVHLSPHDYYGPHTERLKRIKEEVDPLHLLGYPSSL